MNSNRLNNNELKDLSQDNIENFADDQKEGIINWKDEANAIINDVKMHVAEISTSQVLKNNDSHIFLNIRTFEGLTYCVHVSSVGFRIVSTSFDTVDDDKKISNDDTENEVYETPQALLDKISPQYVESFGNALCKELRNLQEMRTELNEEDEDDITENTKVK